MTITDRQPPAPTDDQGGAFVFQVLGWYLGAATTALVDVGHRTGLLEALAAGPATSTELADRTGHSERHLREWLAGTASAGITEFDPATRRFTLPPERAAVLSGTAVTNLAPLAQAIMYMAAFAPAVARTMRDGGGVPYREYGAELSDVQDGINRRLYDAVMVDGYVGAVDGLAERLSRGITALDIGCGSGHALNVLARAFPASTFVGYDISEAAIAKAVGEAEDYGLTNVSFRVRDVTELPATARFDLVTAFDAVHDQAQPRLVLREVRRVLADDGLFLMVDMNARSALEDNLGNPLATYFYWVSLFHCLQVSLAEGGEGLGTAWGVELATELLHQAGFTRVELLPAPAGDPVNVLYACRS
jgi:SAM-dependent methyltransferase